MLPDTFLRICRVANMELKNHSRHQELANEHEYQLLMFVACLTAEIRKILSKNHFNFSRAHIRQIVCKINTNLLQRICRICVILNILIALLVGYVI